MLKEDDVVKGVQVYDISGSIGEVAVNIAFPPVPQKFVTVEVNVIVGGPTVICCVLTHPFASVPVTVYVVGVETDEVTTVPVEASKLAAGAQV